MQQMIELLLLGRVAGEASSGRSALRFFGAASLERPREVVRNPVVGAVDRSAAPPERE